MLASGFPGMDPSLPVGNQIAPVFTVNASAGLSHLLFLRDSDEPRNYFVVGSLGFSWIAVRSSSSALDWFPIPA
jgi:hypothetical protein